MKKKFEFRTPERTPVGTALYQEHIKRAAAYHMAPFAGYMMPLWFSSIADEHRAVRHAAGLFDCTHMGVLEVRGREALDFLQAVTTNDVARLAIGQAQYAYVLDAAGEILDDVIVYRRAPEQFMVVVNAANEAKIKAYWAGLLADEYIVDPADPNRTVPVQCTLQDLRAPDMAQHGMVDIALQGPKSIDILKGLVNGSADALPGLKPFWFVETSIRKIPCLLARTGYTGASVGFELFVAQARASAVWTLLLEKGQDLGLVPCGLGARDSLRIEAGLPLYDHELAGPYNITPFQAGYGWAVKLDKPFFVGRAAMQMASLEERHRVVRIEIPGGKGVRPVRPHDPVLGQDGRCIGWVLSAAGAQDRQVALAFVEQAAACQGTDVGVYYLARSPSQVKQGKRQRVDRSEIVTADLTGRVVPRFAKF